MPIDSGSLSILLCVKEIFVRHQRLQKIRKVSLYYYRLGREFEDIVKSLCKILHEAGEVSTNNRGAIITTDGRFSKNDLNEFFYYLESASPWKMVENAPEFSVTKVQLSILYNKIFNLLKGAIDDKTRYTILRQIELFAFTYYVSPTVENDNQHYMTGGNSFAQGMHGKLVNELRIPIGIDTVAKFLVISSDLLKDINLPSQGGKLITEKLFEIRFRLSQLSKNSLNSLFEGTAKYLANMEVFISDVQYSKILNEIDTFIEQYMVNPYNGHTQLSDRLPELNLIWSLYKILSEYFNRPLRNDEFGAILNIYVKLDEDGLFYLGDTFTPKLLKDIIVNTFDIQYEGRIHQMGNNFPTFVKRAILDAIQSYSRVRMTSKQYWEIFLTPAGASILSGKIGGSYEEIIKDIFLHYNYQEMISDPYFAARLIQFLEAREGVLSEDYIIEIPASILKNNRDSARYFADKFTGHDINVIHDENPDVINFGDKDFKEEKQNFMKNLMKPLDQGGIVQVIPLTIRPTGQLITDFSNVGDPVMKKMAELLTSNDFRTRANNIAHDDLNTYILEHSPQAIFSELYMWMLDPSGQFSLSGKPDLVLGGDGSFYIGDNKPGEPYDPNTRQLSKHMLNRVIQLIVYTKLYRAIALSRNGYDPDMYPTKNFIYNKDVILIFDPDAMLEAVYKFYIYLIMKYRRQNTGIDIDNVIIELQKLPWFMWFPLDRNEVIKHTSQILKEYPEVSNGPPYLPLK